jgi:heme exporter protein B
MKAVLLRDLKLAIRVGGGFGLAVMFFLIVALLVPFGVGPDMALLSAISSGILWISALLACLLSLDRIFSLDFEDGTLDHLAIAPLPLESVVLAKAMAHWLTTGLPLGLIAPLLGLMLGLPAAGYYWLLLSLLLGTPALSVIGTFGAALTLGLRRGGLLLSILVLPLYVPTLIFGAEVARRGIMGTDLQTPLWMLLGLSFGVVAVLPFASAAVLRINLR